MIDHGRKLEAGMGHIAPATAAHSYLRSNLLVFSIANRKRRIESAALIAQKNLPRRRLWRLIWASVSFKGHQRRHRLNPPRNSVTWYFHSPRAGYYPGGKPDCQRIRIENFSIHRGADCTHGWNQHNSIGVVPFTPLPFLRSANPAACVVRCNHRSGLPWSVCHISSFFLRGFPIQYINPGSWYDQLPSAVAFASHFLAPAWGLYRLLL